MGFVTDLSLTDISFQAVYLLILGLFHSENAGNLAGNIECQ